ncbi:MAG: hypothetical protein PHD04_05225 [Candidatus Pacebacteria bacterium]|nr:hypothetical protein [Candidatus Paceibacterota bacterium]
MTDQNQMLEETYRLSKENNRMLHAMRRNAFLGGIVKFIFYILILVVAPLWLYSTYFAPLMQEATRTLNQIQGTGTKTESQLSNFEQMLSQVQSKLPAALNGSQQ